MSKSSKSSLSGLGSFKRDWSTPAPPSSSPEVLIPWEPTQAPKSSKPPSKPLTASERRLIAIQEALAGYSAPPPPSLGGSTTQIKRVCPTRNQGVVPHVLAPSLAQNKRASPTSSSDGTTQKRARQLPPNWLKDDVLSMPSLSSSSIVSNSTKSSTHSKPSTPSDPKTVATVFLSPEQTKILRLVQDGESLFYTGSAGTTISHEILVSSDNVYRIWKVCSPS